MGYSIGQLRLKGALFVPNYPINLDHIAKLANVSRATVSRVINNYVHVSDEIRQRVWAVIATEGYQPNAAARMLVRQRTDVIGVIAPEGLGAIFTGYYFAILLEGIASTITAQEYVMSLWAGLKQSGTNTPYRKILNTRMMDGAIILAAVKDDPLIDALTERKIPLVLLGNDSRQRVAMVDIDNIEIGRVATSHLWGQGRRRIGHIAGPLGLGSAQERLLGYQHVQQAQAGQSEAAFVFEGDYSERSGALGAEHLLAHHVDAIFAANDQMAMGAIRLLGERGRRVPDDVAVVGVDDLPISQNIRPALTTISQPTREIGRVAVDTLIAQIRAQHNKQTITEQPPQRLVLPTTLVIRESCGARAAANR
jgi:DNA-binding LacI/PurR family transcriptional regulator